MKYKNVHNCEACNNEKWQMYVYYSYILSAYQKYHVFDLLASQIFGDLFKGQCWCHFNLAKWKISFIHMCMCVCACPSPGN